MTVRRTSPQIERQWIEFLTPDILRGKLITASIYLAAFELLKECIVDRPKTFFSSGFDENGLIVAPEYQPKVLSRNASPLYASLNWLRELDVIDDSDLETLDALKKVRNSLAHEMHDLAAGRAATDHLAQLPKLLALLRKIEVWWIVNVELPTNPDFDGSKEIDEKEILPGSVAAVSMMLDIALGSDEEAKLYIAAFRQASQQEAVLTRPTLKGLKTRH